MGSSGYSRGWGRSSNAASPRAGGPWGAAKSCGARRISSLLCSALSFSYWPLQLESPKALEVRINLTILFSAGGENLRPQVPLSLTTETGDTSKGQWHSRAGDTGSQLCPSCQGCLGTPGTTSSTPWHQSQIPAEIPKESPGEGQGFRVEQALGWAWNFAVEMTKSTLDLEKSKLFPCPACAEDPNPAGLHLLSQKMGASRSSSIRHRSGTTFQHPCEELPS